MRKLVQLIAAAAVLALPRVGLAQSAEEIIKAMEKNQVHDTAESEGRMVITDRFGARTKTFKAFAAGTDRMLLEFTNPEEKGQKILRLQDEIYLYFPDAEEIIHLQGNALKESVMGSDFSYEDMTGEKGLLSLYDVNLLGREEIAGRSCYRLKLTGKKRGVAYPQQMIWVDEELMALKRAEYFSLSGKPLKEMEVTEVKRISGKNVPVSFLMKDLLKKDSSTDFSFSRIVIDQPLPANIFSREALSW